MRRLKLAMVVNARQKKKRNENKLTGVALINLSNKHCELKSLVLTVRYQTLGKM
jgi:hypothetical protein